MTGPEIDPEDVADEEAAKAARQLRTLFAWREKAAERREAGEVWALERARYAAPDGWEELETEAPRPPSKRKVTLRVDEDVLAWFRDQGRGHQTRMNDVLRAFMVMRRGGVV